MEEKPNIPPRPTQAAQSGGGGASSAASNNKVRRAPPPRRKSPPPSGGAAVGPKFPTPSSGHDNLDRPVVTHEYSHIPTRDIQPHHLAAAGGSSTAAAASTEKSGMKGLLNNLVTSVQGK